MKIALTGNPNSGKTTLFNAITGKIEKVGNWSGVTIEKKEGKIKENLYKNKEIIGIDLPGAYSMSPFTNEESITRDFVKDENPDVIVNIVDSTNLSRSLFFTTQLLELGIPVVVALNKYDLTKKNNIEIDVEKLEKELGCPVVKTIATKNKDNGLKKLIKRTVDVQGNDQKQVFNYKNADLSNKEEAKEIDKKRFNFVKSLVSNVEIRKENSKQLQKSVDNIVANKVLGLPIFAVIMWAVFAISQTYVGPLLADTFVGWIDKIYAIVETSLGESVSPILSALLLDGIIGGVGAVVGFLPLIMVLFFLLALLEDSGYMARVAVIMDRFFKKVGLSGKSIIPMVIGTGCAIPGVMATRTIKNKRQRRTTAMLTPFMPCGAKLPVIALFAGVFFPNSSWVGPSMYFMGIAIIIIGALVVRKITGEEKRQNHFIMELPDYKVPSIKRAFISMISRGKAFVIKAATIILICNAIIQIMQTFTWNFNVVAQGAQDTSILASIASPFAILLIPLGFGTWQLAAAAITGFIAKENVVGTLAVVYSITNFINPEEFALVNGASEVASTMGLTQVAALAYLVFNLFTPPCFAAIGAMNAEMESKKWLFGGVAFQFSVGYIVAFITYQFGTLFTKGNLGNGFISGSIAVIIMISFIVYLMKRENSMVNNEASVNA